VSVVDKNVILKAGLNLDTSTRAKSRSQAEKFPRYSND
jgi:hypothetical protein